MLFSKSTLLKNYRHSVSFAQLMLIWRFGRRARVSRRDSCAAVDFQETSKHMESEGRAQVHQRQRTVEIWGAELNSYGPY